MKKNIIIVLLLALSFSSVAQEKEQYPQDTEKKHELKLNAFSLIVLSAVDVNYEKILSENSSFGVSLFFNLKDIEDNFYFPRKFSLTPYFRWFFSEDRYAKGFFAEGFGMLNTYKSNEFYIGSTTLKRKNETDFALGISVGGKFIIKPGFITEIYLGVGRNLLNKGIVSRGGISLGYRF